MSIKGRIDPVELTVLLNGRDIESRACEFFMTGLRKKTDLVALCLAGQVNVGITANRD